MMGNCSQRCLIHPRRLQEAISPAWYGLCPRRSRPQRTGPAVDGLCHVALMVSSEVIESPLLMLPRALEIGCLSQRFCFHHRSITTCRARREPAGGFSRSHGWGRAVPRCTSARGAVRWNISSEAAPPGAEVRRRQRSGRSPPPLLAGDALAHGGLPAHVGRRDLFSVRFAFARTGSVPRAC